MEQEINEWTPVCGPEGMVVWTGSMFGTCFATILFSYLGHFTAVGVTAFFLGRFPKSTAVREPFELPRILSYILQVVLTLLICDPLIKLIVVIFISGKQNSFVEDFKLMLMFTTWALNLTYYRRLAISNYIRLPGIVPIVGSCTFLFLCQIPVLLSVAYKDDYLNLGFLAAYEFLMLLAILAYCVLFFDVKRTLFKTYPYNTSVEPPEAVESGSGAYGVTPARPFVQSEDDGIVTQYKPPAEVKNGIDNPTVVCDEK